MMGQAVLRLKVELLTRGAQHIPWRLLRKLVAQTTGGMRVAFCLHRVRKTRRPNELLPSLSVTEAVLDEFIEQMRAARSPAEDPRWLTMAFDDGYRDAARYVASRANRYPDVEWLLFVCPHKVKERQGFRWDAYEKRSQEGTALPEYDAYVHELDTDYERELKRRDLRDVAGEDCYALATRQELLQAASFKNVNLGNHSNTHMIDSLPLDQALRDLEESTRLFEEMFGPCRQFAFPFGVPGQHFRKPHVEYLRNLRPVVMWTTEQKPYFPEQRRPGALLPRIVFDGEWSAKAMALWVVLRANRMSSTPLIPRFLALAPTGLAGFLAQAASGV